MVHKTEKPIPPKKIEEIKDAKSNKLSNQQENTNHSDLDQLENNSLPKRNESRLSSHIELNKPEGTEVLSAAVSKAKTDVKTEDNKSDHAIGEAVKELEADEEEDQTEKLYTKDFSRTGRFRVRPKRKYFRLDEEGERNEDDEYEEQKEKKEEGEDENVSYFIRNHTNIIEPLSKLDWQTAYKIVKDTDSLAFLQWLPKNNTNYLQLNNEICHIIPRKFLLLEWKNAGIIGMKEEKGDLLPFERIIYSVIVGPKHEVYRGVYEIGKNDLF